MTGGSGRAVWAEIDLAAIRHNAGVLSRFAAPAELCAVVKAGAYGHGSIEVSRAALEGGATWLAVAFVEEGVALRGAGITAPILLLSEPSPDAMDEVVTMGLVPTLYTLGGVERLAKAVADRRTGEAVSGPVPVHVKVDTGMHRVGASPVDAVEVAKAVAERAELNLDGLFTHFALADDPGSPVTVGQAAQFDDVVSLIAAQGVHPRVLHACNSAATLLFPSAHHQMVRCGIGLYGVGPSPVLAGGLGLRPALSLRARVSHVAQIPAGDGVSYGHHHRCAENSVMATLPIGYADGLAWRLGCGRGEVLVGGHRRPIAGRVTMDQVMVDCGDDRGVAVGDEAVLIGSQGDQSIDAWTWAERLGTIVYEVLCGISPRVPRRFVDSESG